MTVKTQNKRKMTIICSTIIYDDKKSYFFIRIYLIYAERSLEDFLFKWYLYRHIATISAAADEGPGEMTCFPAGLLFINFPNKNVQK